MPIENSGEIRLRGTASDGRTDINEEINSNATDTDVSLGTLNTTAFTAVSDGSVVTGRAMSEMRGYSAFTSALPQTEATGALGESLLFSASDNVYLQDANMSLDTNNKTFTTSLWVKRNKTGATKHIFNQSFSTTDILGFKFNSDDTLLFSKYKNGASDNFNVYSEHKLIDTSSWYHIVLAVDTTKTYANDRVRIYVNGIELKTTSGSTFPAQNQNLYVNNGAYPYQIGRINYSLNEQIGGTIADYKHIDGKQLRPDSFGELVQGIWIPKAFNTASTDTLVTDNLNVNLQFVGNANDEKDNYDGTPTSVNFLSNNYGIADFNGSSSKLELGAGALASGTGAKSITMWIATTTTAYSSLVKTGNGSANQYWLFRVNSGTSLGISGFLGSGDFDVNVSHTGLFNGSWHQVTVTYDGTTQELFVDGQSVGTKTMSSLNIPSQKVFIGYQANSNGSGASSYFDGQIGEVQFYNDQLTKEEVLQNYNATKHKYTYGLNGFWLPLNNTSTGSIDSSSNLKLHLDASDNSSYSGSGTDWLDLTSNGVNGTISNINYLSSTNGGIFDFNGSNSRVNLSSNPINGLIEITMECWINSDGTQSGDRYILSFVNQIGGWRGAGIRYTTANKIQFIGATTSGSVYTKNSTKTLTNTEWYHIAMTATQSETKIYINGILDSTHSTSGFGTNNTGSFDIGMNEYNTNVIQDSFDGKIAQVRVYDGILTAQEVITNYRATQGNYEQVSTVDISGNANSFTATNINATDHIKDEPLDNYATFDPTLESTGGTLSEGNLKATSSADTFVANKSFNSGKWYAEFTFGSTTNGYIGVFGTDYINPNMAGGWSGNGAIAYKQNGDQYSLTKGSSSATASYGSSYTSGDVIGVEIDISGNTIEFYKNGVSQGQTTNGPSYIGATQYSFAIYGNTSTVTANFGQKPWAYGPSTGFLALSNSNLPAPAFDPDGATPDKPSNYFKAVTYQGNGGTQGEAYGYKEGSRAAVFNGSSSKIATGLTLPADSTMSFSFWLKSASNSSGNNYFLSDFDSLGSNNSSRLSLAVSTNNGFRIWVSNGSSYWNSTDDIDLSSYINLWTNLVVVLNGTDIKVYINGGTPTTLTSSVAFGTAGARQQYIGGVGGNNGASYEGSIDEVRIFDKALSLTEVGYLADDDTTNIDAISNLVAHYDMEGDADDTGSYLYGTGAIDSGQSAVFNGSSSYIDLGQRILGGTHSASAWVKTSTTGTRQVIIGNAYDGSTFGLSIFIENDNKLNLEWSHSNSWIKVIDPTANRVNDGDWHHVAYFISAGSQKIYVDGVEVASGTTSSTAQNNTTAPTIIGRNWNASAYFDGKIDQVRIYSSALSVSDVEALVSETNVPTANLVAHYKLDGNANDETTNYNGTWGGTEAYSDPAEFPNVAYNGTPTNVTYTQDKPYGNIDVGFAPDLVWVKNRTSTSGYYHGIFDSVRGVNKVISSNNTDSENQYGNWTQQLTSFDSDGFSLGDNSDSGNYVNLSGDDYVAWCFNAADTTTTIAANTVGNTIASDVRANTDAGFSISKFTIPSSGSSVTVSHQLSSAPELLIVKTTDKAGSWFVYTQTTGASKEAYLELTNAFGTDLNRWANTAPTSSVFTLGSSWLNSTYSGEAIAYCFHSVDGFSKIGSYTGNASTTDGPFVYTGFKPAWIMIKQSSASGTRWIILDNARRTENPATGWLSAEYSGSEQTDSSIALQFMSNGFKVGNPGTSNASLNGSGQTYIYMAFAEDPVKYSNGVATLGDGNEFIQDGNYPEDNFSATAYTGNGGTQKIVTGYKPDLVWIKQRNITQNHRLFDSVRGATNILSSSNTDAQGTNSQTLTSFDSNGFSLRNNVAVNTNNGTYVAWSWKAGGLINKAAEFNGSSSTVILPNTGPFGDSNTIKSISAWVKLNDTTSNTTDNAWIYSVSSSDTYDWFYVGYRPTQNKIQVYRRTAASDYAQTDATITPDTDWHHVLVQLTSTEVEIYLDGTKLTTTNTNSGTGSNTSWIDYPNYSGTIVSQIGKSRVNIPKYYDGKIDQVRFFNKALSTNNGGTNEIEKLYNETAADLDTLQILGDTSCVAAYKLGEDAIDLSGNYNGTASNVKFEKPGHLTRNNEGTIESEVSANQTNGFSIAKYTGNGTAGSTVGHGLSKPPELIIVKGLDNTLNWIVYHTDIGATKYIQLNTTGDEELQSNYNMFNSTAPSSTVFSLGNLGNTNGSNLDYIAYCWYSVPGFSKIGSYAGGNTNVKYTGFEPAFLMVKRADTSGNWHILDNKRTGSNNIIDDYLRANLPDAEQTDIGQAKWQVYFTSEGFYFGDVTSSSLNISGGTFIYMAFAHR